MGKRNRGRGGPRSGGGGGSKKRRVTTRADACPINDDAAADTANGSSSINHQQGESTTTASTAAVATTQTNSWQRLVPNSGTTATTIDAPTRHTILTALLHSKFHPETLTRRTTSYPVELLQAVLHQVLPPLNSNGGGDGYSASKSKKGKNAAASTNRSTELHCSIAAVTCLSNYVAFTPDTSVDTDTTLQSVLEQDDAISVEWLSILIQRLQDCLLRCDEAHTTSSTSSSNSTATPSTTISTNDMVWLELLEACLTAIVNLVEHNPLCCDQKLVQLYQGHGSGRSTTTATTRYYDYSLWNCLAQVLKQSHKAAILCPPASAAVAKATNVASKQSQQLATEMTLSWQRIQTLAAQCLHSAWDDNAELVEPLFFQFGNGKRNNSSGSEDGPAVCNELLQCLCQTMIVPSSSTATTASTAATLHAAGAGMALWLLVQSSNNDTTARRAFAARELPLVETMLSPSVDCVAQTLSTSISFVQLQLNEHVARVRQAELDFTAEVDDDHMEQDVLQHQQTKQEPARLIARRLHPRPGSGSNTSGGVDPSSDGVSSAMDTATTVTHGDKKTKLQRKDASAIWDAAQTEWEETIRPLQLALELVANWTTLDAATSNAHEASTTDDNDIVMQDVADLVPSLPPQLVTALNKSNVTSSLHQVFVILSEWWSRQQPATNTDKTSANYDGSIETKTPQIVVESIADCLSKAAVAIGHFLVAGIGEEQNGKKGKKSGKRGNVTAIARVPWSTFLLVCSTMASRVVTVAADETADGAAGGSLSDDDASMLAAVVTSMGMALQADPTLSTQVSNADVDAMLSLLSTMLQPFPAVARDIVALLGNLVCATTERSLQSVQICQTISKALIQASTAVSSTRASSDAMVENDASSTEHQYPSAAVLAEVLNIFMDIYGNDDDEDEDSSILSLSAMFDQLGLLRHFQQSVPLLKQKIAVEELTKNCTEDDLDAWKEIALNASRFIEYKKEMIG